MSKAATNDMESAAKRLAAANADAEPAIQEIYWFPDEDEIRLIEIDETAVPYEDFIAPFYFPADPEGHIPFRSALAMVTPDDKKRLPPPEGWGAWEDAVRIWPEAAD